MTHISRLILLLPLALVFVAGCSSPASVGSKVSGKVTYNGKVVPAGSITFYAPEGGGIYTYSLLEGEYSGSDMPAAEMVVSIETESANPKGRGNTSYDKAGKQGGDPNDYRAKMQAMGKVPEGPANKGEYVKIPAKYGSKATSPLKVTLTRGSNKHNFELTD